MKYLKILIPFLFISNIVFGQNTAWKAISLTPYNRQVNGLDEYKWLYGTKTVDPFHLQLANITDFTSYMVGNYYNKAQADGRYLPLTGGQLTGMLKITSSPLGNSLTLKTTSGLNPSSVAMQDTAGIERFIIGFGNKRNSFFPNQAYLTASNTPIVFVEYNTFTNQVDTVFKIDTAGYANYKKAVHGANAVLPGDLMALRQHTWANIPDKPFIPTLPNNLVLNDNYATQYKINSDGTSQYANKINNGTGNISFSSTLTNGVPNYFYGGNNSDNLSLYSFPTAVRSLFSVVGNGFYNAITGVFTINQPTAPVGLKLPYISIGTDYLVSVEDYYVDLTEDNAIVTLPTCTAGQTWEISNNGGGTLRVVPPNGWLINGNPFLDIPPSGINSYRIWATSFNQFRIH